MLLRMFLNLDRKDPSALAIVDDSGERLTYGRFMYKAERVFGGASLSDAYFYSC